MELRLAGRERHVRAELAQELAGVGAEAVGLAAGDQQQPEQPALRAQRRDHQRTHPDRAEAMQQRRGGAAQVGLVD